MASEAAALLDQLMGRNRNAVSGEDVVKEHWSDPEVCKYFLCGFCPSELFTNTRSDIGPCEKIHDEALQIAYTGSSQNGKMGYEEQFLECLERIVRDLDKRIQRGRERLARSAEANKKAFIDESGDMYSERLHELSLQISELIHQSEVLGNEGNVDEAQELISRVEELEREKERERSAMMFKANVPQTVAGFEIDPGNFHEKNEICDVCGCFLIIGDTQARMDAHLMGKQHMGFSRIRSKIVELKQEREDKLTKEREERKTRRESKSARSPPRNRSRSRDRSRRHSHRSRSRDRDRHRSRSRDRDRKRERSRERKKRSSRSRSRDRRNRSKSRERKRRSRSKSKERKRSRSRDAKRKRRSRSRSHERSRRRDRDRSRSKERSHHDKHRSRSRSKDKKKREGEKEQVADERRISKSDHQPENHTEEEKEVKQGRVDAEAKT